MHMLLSWSIRPTLVGASMLTTLAICGPTVLRGQDTASTVTPAQLSCDSALRRERVDSVHVRGRATLVRTDEGVLPETFRSALLQELGARLELPRPLQLLVFEPGPTRLRMLRPERLSGDTTVRAPMLYAIYDFQLHRDRRVDSVRVLLPSLAPSFDSAVVTAIHSMNLDPSLPAFPAEVKGRTMRLQLRLTSGASDTRIRRPELTLFEANVPRYHVIDAAPSAANLPPVYPEAERDDGDDGEALFQIVVDAAGQPNIATVELLHATSAAFAEAALQALASYRFTPARIGTCTVPQIVHVPFFFSLRP